MTSGPKIHAVVDVNVRTEGLWAPLPSEPWPPFVRLHRSAPAEHVALVVGVLSSYGRDSESPATSPADLLTDFPGVLPGGLAVVSADRTLLPGCCCGLESWTEWCDLLESGRAPWTGHDPAPLVEAARGAVRVWPDGALGGTTPLGSPVTFSKDDFLGELARVAGDLEAFLGPLRAWLDQAAPQEAADLVARFVAAFVRR